MNKLADSTTTQPGKETPAGSDSQDSQHPDPNHASRIAAPGSGSDRVVDIRPLNLWVALVPLDRVLQDRIQLEPDFIPLERFYMLIDDCLAIVPKVNRATRTKPSEDRLSTRGPVSSRAGYDQQNPEEWGTRRGM